MVMGETHIPKIVGSNPSTVTGWTFCHLYLLLKLLCLNEETKINEKKDGHFTHYIGRRLNTDDPKEEKAFTSASERTSQRGVTTKSFATETIKFTSVSIQV